MARTIEERLADMEKEMAWVKRRLDSDASRTTPWWETIRGTFKDDPIYDEAMRLGRDWRKSVEETPDSPPAKQA